MPSRRSIFEVDEDGEPLLEGYTLQVAKSKAAVVLVRMDPDDNKPAKGREDWAVDGILCYSKICTHVGCPISLNERKTHHLLCPCHQSTFDLADAAKVVFGPAARAAAPAAAHGRRRGLPRRPERLQGTCRTQLLGARLAGEHERMSRNRSSQS